MGDYQSAIRAFIAIELPPQVRAMLSTIQEELRESLGSAEGAIRWVKPDAVHLTIQFLGDVPQPTLQQVKLGLGRASQSASGFSLEVTGLGTFPSLNRPRVVWVGLNGDAEDISALRKLHASLAGEMKQLGFRPDNSFKPHLTLGRVHERASRDDIATLADVLRSPDARPTFATSFDVHGISLMRSELHPGGPIYTRLAHFDFPKSA